MENYRKKTDAIESGLLRSFRFFPFPGKHFLNFFKFIVIGIFLSSSALANSQGFFSRCQSWYERLIQSTAKQDQYQFHPELWEKHFGKNPESPRIHGLHIRDDSSPLIWEAWAQLPRELREDFKELVVRAEQSRGNKRLIVRLEELKKKAGIPAQSSSETFYSHLISDVDRPGEPPVDWRMWFAQKEKLHNDFMEQSPMQAANIRAELHQAQKINKANNAWKSSIGAAAPKTWSDRGKLYIIIGNQSFRAYPAVKNGFRVLQIEVPTEQIAHPAWNPMESAKMTNILTKNIPPPSEYKTVLGPDGKFYLQDGNHRFAIHGKSKRKNLVEISEPPRTMNLSAYFDSIGRSQPSQQQILDLYEGRITIRELLGEEDWDRAILFHEQKN